MLHDFSDLGLKIDAPDLLVHHMLPHFLMGAVCLMIDVTLTLNLFHLSENQTGSQLPCQKLNSSGYVQITIILNLIPKNLRDPKRLREWLRTAMDISQP